MGFTVNNSFGKFQSETHLPLPTFSAESLMSLSSKQFGAATVGSDNLSNFEADTSKDVGANAGKGVVSVKWYANSGKYFWDRSSIGMSGYASTGSTSADSVTNWLRNTLNATKGMGVKFLSLAPHDTAQPIDCEMFAWGSWSNWSEWSDCVDGSQLRTRTKTRAAKTPAANGGAACPTDLEQTETETQTCGGTSGRSDNGDGDDNGDDNGDVDPPANGDPVSGCTSVTATNYNSTATIDDGSCIEPSGDDDDDEDEDGPNYLLYGGGLALLVVGGIMASKMKKK